jgi:hypothetical protein
MCTCGIDIATQHPTPASMSKACKPFGDRPSAAKRGARRAASAVAAAAPPGDEGGGRRSTKASGSIVARQNTPTPKCACRQPTVSMKCCMTGGQMAPAK